MALKICVCLFGCEFGRVTGRAGHEISGNVL